MNILIAIIVFSVLILFHEFGHFLLARLCRVRVIEFSLGMGPRLLSHVTMVRLETEPATRLRANGSGSGC